jgi:hypothetical protein
MNTRRSAYMYSLVGYGILVIAGVVFLLNWFSEVLVVNSISLQLFIGILGVLAGIVGVCGSRKARVFNKVCELRLLYTGVPDQNPCAGFGNYLGKGVIQMHQDAGISLRSNWVSKSVKLIPLNGSERLPVVSGTISAINENSFTIVLDTYTEHY